MSAKNRLRLPREATIDRRVARTRMALYDAIAALVLRQDYASITVADILAEANIGRSTFYAHFTSKDDLLGRSLERLKAALIDACGDHLEPSEDAGASWTFSGALFEHISEYRDIHYALAGTRGGEIVTEAIGGVLRDVLRERLPATPYAELPRELVIRHIVATFTTVMHWWLEHAPRTPPAEADRMFRQIVQAGGDAGPAAAAPARSVHGRRPLKARASA
jgi:AcrR family transcriptional regulator